MATPREVTPWSTDVRSIDRTSRPEPDESEARELAPVLMFGSLEFADTRRPSATDIRPKPAPATSPGETKEAGPPAEADPKVLSGSSATSNAVSSPDDTSKNGNTPTPETTPLAIHPSSLSDDSVTPATAEKDPNLAPSLLQ